MIFLIFGIVFIKAQDWKHFFMHFCSSNLFLLAGKSFKPLVNVFVCLYVE